jgi:hypothetical protein
MFVGIKQLAVWWLPTTTDIIFMFFLSRYMVFIWAPVTACVFSLDDGLNGWAVCFV